MTIAPSDFPDKETPTQKNDEPTKPEQNPADQGAGDVKPTGSKAAKDQAAASTQKK